MRQAAENRSSVARHNRIVGERIKSARSKAKLTQADLARRLKLRNTSAVSQSETARTASSTERLVLLADALDVSVDWLLGRVQDAGHCSRPVAAVADDLLLLEEARRLNVDLRKVIAEARQRQWRTETVKPWLMPMLSWRVMDSGVMGNASSDAVRRASKRQ